MPNLCLACDTPAAESQLCTGCYNRTKWRLEELHLNTLELHTAMQRQVRMTERGDGGKSAETALYFNERAAATIHLIRTTLVSWVRTIADDTGAPLPQRITTSDLTDFLLAALTEFRIRPDAGLFADEIRHITDESIVVVDLPVNRSVIPVGPCPEDEGDNTEGANGTSLAPCPGTIRAIIPNNAEQRPVMRCGTCRTEWFAEQWHTVGKRIIARQGRKIQMDPDAARRLLSQLGAA